MGSRTCQKLGFVLSLGSVSILLFILYSSRHSTLQDLLSDDYSTGSVTLHPPTVQPSPRTQWDPNQRYLVYLPYEGISNQFYSFQNAATMAKRLNRTLVVPPITSNRHDRLGTHQPWSHYMDLEYMSTHSGIRVVEWHTLKPMDQEALRVAEMGNRTQISNLWQKYAEPLPCQVIRGFGHDHFVQTEDDFIGADFAYKFLLDLQPIPVPGYAPGDSVFLVDDILNANMDSTEPMVCFTFTFTAQFAKDKNRWDIAWEAAGQYARFLPRFASYVEDLIAYRFGILGDRFNGIAVPTDNNDNNDNLEALTTPAQATAPKRSATAAKKTGSDSRRSRFRHRQDAPQPETDVDPPRKQLHQVHPHPPWDLGNSILDQGPKAETFLSRKPALDDYIAIHLRRGDIEIKCVNNTGTPNCVVPVSEYKTKVDAILNQLRQDGGYLEDHEEEEGEEDEKKDLEEQLDNDDVVIPVVRPPRKKRLPKVVLVSDTKSDEEKKEIDSYGWYRLDHDLDSNLIDASKVLGPFSPALIDSAVLTGRGARWVIGSRRSTMSWLAAMRTLSWFNRKIIYPRDGKPPKPKKKKPNSKDGNDKGIAESKKLKASSLSRKIANVDLDRRGMYIMNSQEDSVVIWDRDEQEFFDSV